jgi:hypothetical protein
MQNILLPYINKIKTMANTPFSYQSLPQNTNPSTSKFTFNNTADNEAEAKRLFKSYNLTYNKEYILRGNDRLSFPPKAFMKAMFDIHSKEKGSSNTDILIQEYNETLKRYLGQPKRFDLLSNVWTLVNTILNEIGVSYKQFVSNDE